MKARTGKYDLSSLKCSEMIRFVFIGMWSIWPLRSEKHRVWIKVVFSIHAGERDRFTLSQGVWKGKGGVFFYRLSGHVSSKLVLTSSGSVSAGLLVLISTVMNSKVIYHLGLLSSYVSALINKCILWFEQQPRGSSASSVFLHAHTLTFVLLSLSEV